MHAADTKPYVWMLCGSAWFSLMGVMANAVGDLIDWQVVALARSGLATLFALLIAGLTGSALVFFRPAVLWLRSLSGSCSMLTTFYALTHMPVSDVLTLTNTFPIWVALLSWPLLNEKPTFGVWIAVLCSVVGVAMTQRPDIAGLAPAAWSAVAASFFTAVAMLGLNRLKGVSAMGVVVHFSAVATLFCIAAFFVFDRRTEPSQSILVPKVSGLLLGVGISATIGQVFLTRAFRSGSATKVSVVGLSQVVMVMAIEAAFGRRFDLLALIGTVLVLGPTGWLMTRSKPNTESVAID